MESGRVRPRGRTRARPLAGCRRWSCRRPARTARMSRRPGCASALETDGFPVRQIETFGDSVTGERCRLVWLDAHNRGNRARDSVHGVAVEGRPTEELAETYRDKICQADRWGVVTAGLAKLQQLAAILRGDECF